MNEVILLGNAGKDATVKYSKDGKMIVFLSIATTKKWNEVQTTSWHNVSCFSYSALAAEGIKKGDLVFVKGELTYRKDAQGVEKAGVIAHRIGKVERPLTSKQETAPPINSFDEDEELPF